MSFWDGTKWSDAESAPSTIAPKSTGSRRANWAATAVMVIGAMALILPLAATSAASHRYSDPPCTISASSVGVGETYWVSVAGLPTGIAINLWVTDSTGTTGSPLGSTGDGTFSMQESSNVSGTTTYAFSGPTKRNSVVYSTCSVDAT
jgi:hypothetical protein